MTRTLALFVAAASVFAGTAGADPHPYAAAHDVAVRLASGPCAQAGGRVDRARGRDRCVVPVVVFEPPDPCLQAHGVMVETAAGRRGCALRSTQVTPADGHTGVSVGKRQ